MQIFCKYFGPNGLTERVVTIAATHVGDADFQVGLGGRDWLSCLRLSTPHETHAYNRPQPLPPH